MTDFERAKRLDPSDGGVMDKKHTSGRPLESYFARSASDRSDDWPYWFVADRDKCDLNVTAELQESEEIACRFDGTSHRIGKRAAGRLLDDREWNEMPHARPAPHSH